MNEREAAALAASVRRGANAEDLNGVDCRLSPLGERLAALKHLQPNWDSYGAEPPNTAAFEAAERVLDGLAGSDLEVNRLLPSAEGGVAIIFTTPTRYADIECLNSNQVLAVTSDRVAEPEVWEVDLDSLSSTLERIREFLTR